MTVQNTPTKSWLVDQPAPEQGAELATHVMNIMEQGIIVWSADGVCQLHNTRIYEVLDLTGEELTIGTARDDFLRTAVERGEFDEKVAEKADRLFQAHKPFSFDRCLPSGRTISTNARPSREGGFVVTYTDVTSERKMAAKLEIAMSEAAKAEARTAEVLRHERARQEEGRMIGQLDEWLQSCKSLQELFQIVSAFMARLFPNSSGELLVYSNSRDVLEGACAWGQDVSSPQIAPDSCWALRRGRSYLYEPDQLCFPCEHVHSKDGIGRYICVPIVAHGDTVGLLHVTMQCCDAAKELTDPQTLASRCGEHISMAIANVKLRDELHSQSIRDPLTGLYNRRHFVDALRREMGKAASGSGGLALISFDADHFKRFNDDHGHDAGDAVLQSISEVMLETMPDTATCCRVGGEEFAILLPLNHDLDAATAADDLRQAIAQMSVRYHHCSLPRVTISAGVARYTDGQMPPPELIKAADQALYRAKEAGRNRIVEVKM